VSNVIGGTQGTPYFQVPDSFVRRGDLRDMSGSAVKYYVFLCQQLNQTGQVELEYTNQDICTYTGIKDHNTARKAREELQERGRIRLRKGPSGGFIHSILSDVGNVFTPVKGRKAVRLRIPQERQRREAAFIRRFCYVHGGETNHWDRGGESVCDERHPRVHKHGSPPPESSNSAKSSRKKAVQAAWRQPNADEIGF